MIAAILSTAALLAGCGPSSPPDDGFALAKARAAVAFAAAEIARSRPDAPPSACACGGTGTVPTGDGLDRVPCECGAACSCRRDDSPAEPATPAEPTSAEHQPARRKRLLYFTAAWCPTCRANEPTLAALSAAGWRVGPGEECHVQTVDLDARPDLAARYGVSAVPTWLLTDAGRERRRRTGVLDPFAIGALFDE